jgi:hypothetical protein
VSQLLNFKPFKMKAKLITAIVLAISTPLCAVGLFMITEPSAHNLVYICALCSVIGLTAVYSYEGYLKSKDSKWQQMFKKPKK